MADYINNCIKSSKDSSCRKKKDFQSLIISKTVVIFLDSLSVESGEFSGISRTIATASIRMSDSDRVQGIVRSRKLTVCICHLLIMRTSLFSIGVH